MSRWWYCNVCRAQNHEIDGECQYCECQGLKCKRDNCSDRKHFHMPECTAVACDGECIPPEEAAR